MSNPQAALDGADLAMAHQPKIATPTFEKQVELGGSDSIAPSSTDVDDSDIPTVEELHTLRRVTGAVPWQAYTVALIEMFERFSYYGTTVVCKKSSQQHNKTFAYYLTVTNFIQRPLPVGSTTGAPITTKGIPGALGKGQAAAFGLTTCMQQRGPIRSCSY